jgi:hypothetical protein
MAVDQWCRFSCSAPDEDGPWCFLSQPHDGMGSRHVDISSAPHILIPAGQTFFLLPLAHDSYLLHGKDRAARKSLLM